MTSYDVAIVGGGAMGSAAAYYLRTLQPDLSVVVLEKDPTYEYCSTLRSDGNLRIQFNLEENIRMSMYTMELLETFADDMEVDGWRPDPAAREQGNLFLVEESHLESAEEGMATQRGLGCEVEWLDAATIADRYPAYRTEGVVGGILGPRDGSIDPHAVMHGLRRNAIRLGAEYVSHEVAAINTAGGRVGGIQLATGESVEAATVVICAGGWSTTLARTAGIELPIVPIMRTVFVVDTEVDTAGLPSIFLPGGTYVLPEGHRSFSMARSLPTDPIGFDFKFSRSGFEELVWAEVVRTLPGFDRLTVTGGWNGVYALNTLDGNAILGEWPALDGLFLAAGFSGHGFQHSPAMGRYIAELITGVEPILDLSRLGPGRIISGEPLFEHAGRII
ncbi:MAG: FAD-binding oxidoreductase [bacterium]|nr:FAD-binding oxidoreductase [bacterium]